MYHLTITDNDTGKVLEDLDCSIIIAGGTRGRGATSSSRSPAE